MRPPLAIVVPVHDRPELLEACFRSLEAWRSELDIVVVDDGSTAPGIERLRRAPPGARPIRWLRNDRALGFSAAVNRGVAATSGDPILLLNSDAEVRPGGDDALLEALDRHPEAGAVAARLVFPDGTPQWSGGAEPTLLWLFALASAVAERRGRARLAQGRAPSGFDGGEVDWAPAAALAVRRAAWNTTGPLDESFSHYAQDLDYGHRLRASGFRVRVEPGFVVAHHLGGSAGEAAQGGQRLDRLWSDLVRWVGKARGPAAARRARAALRAGARFRLLRLALAGRDEAARDERLRVRVGNQSHRRAPRSRPVDLAVHEARLLSVSRSGVGARQARAPRALSPVADRLRLDDAPAAAHDDGPAGRLLEHLPVRPAELPGVRALRPAVLELLRAVDRRLDEQPARQRPADPEAAGAEVGLSGRGRRLGRDQPAARADAAPRAAVRDRAPAGTGALLPPGLDPDRRRSSRSARACCSPRSR